MEAELGSTAPARGLLDAAHAVGDGVAVDAEGAQPPRPGRAGRARRGKPPSAPVARGPAPSTGASSARAWRPPPGGADCPAGGNGGAGRPATAGTDARRSPASIVERASVWRTAVCASSNGRETPTTWLGRSRSAGKDQTLRIGRRGGRHDADLDVWALLGVPSGGPGPVPASRDGPPASSGIFSLMPRSRRHRRAALSRRGRPTAVPRTEVRLGGRVDRVADLLVPASSSASRPAIRVRRGRARRRVGHPAGARPVPQPRHLRRTRTIARERQGEDPGRAAGRGSAPPRSPRHGHPPARDRERRPRRPSMATGRPRNPAIAAAKAWARPGRARPAPGVSRSSPAVRARPGGSREADRAPLDRRRIAGPGVQHRDPGSGRGRRGRRGASDARGSATSNSPLTPDSAAARTTV
jgi:hypothetical protein